MNMMHNKKINESGTSTPSMPKKWAALMVAATLTLGVTAPLSTSYVQAAGANTQAKYVDLAKAGHYSSAVEALIKQQVMTGYDANKVKPDKHVTRAELAKMIVLGLNVELVQAGTLGESNTYKDVAPKDWYSSYVASLTNVGVKVEESETFKPNQAVTRDEFTALVATVLNKDTAEVQKWVAQLSGEHKQVTRAEAAFIIHHAQRMQPSAQAEVTSIHPLNASTLQVTFSARLTPEDVNLDQAKKNFVFDNGIELTNVPQLMTGAVSTYIVPTTPQKAGAIYNLTYKGKAAGSFTASSVMIAMRTVQQVSNDTIETVSSLADHITDYGNVIAAYSGKRGGLDFALDENNRYNGAEYQIISSMRGKQVTLTPERGEPIVAGYIPFTQATDGRQAPKFRLPAGVTLQPGMKYTVTSAWATFANGTFTAQQVAPLVIQEVKANDASSVQVTLAADPQDELFAGRSITLTAADGSSLQATYKFTTRKGATGTFEVANGGKLAAGTTYKVSATGGWASAANVSVTKN
ncbi:S-layer homology domain-containing protein [Paenibacillus sp. 481]|uniref:S-layer homology domain-containing protein n=1 Tax=Paenibacillus sp. 481 TaxID=2835869 RepID=UPI001E2FF92D|nr:S-layer homology domain-containing protein [Paenibacillus sp. 481]UHA74876.1 S-layer homology domain-containing protein [Paenibacillus sp. 481]